MNANNNEIRQLPANESFGDGGSNTTDAQSIVAQPKAYTRPDPRLFLSTDSGVDSGLKDFLERPHLLTSFTFSATDTASTFANVEPITALMGLPHFADKLKGRYILRCNIRVILQINASKFQAGRYIMAWVPSGGSKGSTFNAAAWLKMHRHSLTQITQLPHVELDVNKDSQAELIIPYVNSQLGAFAQNTTTYGDVGWIFAYPYSTIASAAGSTTVYGSLFLKMEDVELGGIAYPQMAWKGPKTAPTSVEQEQESIGPVTSTLRNISTSAGILSKIPLLTNFAGPAAWVTDTLANAANVWGWSRPLNVGKVERVLQQPLGFGASCDVVDTAQPLSLSSANAVTTLAGVGGTDLDEMSIDYLKAIPAFIERVTWSSASPANTSLFNRYVDPKLYTTTTDGVNTLTNYTPLGLLATYFQLWRGSMTFIFKLVKTDFHTGRLMVTFTPTSPKRDANLPPSISTSEYVHREIWDVREKTEFRVTVPYVSNTPWLRTDIPMGIITVKIMDPLIAPTTVSSSVEVLVEACAGPDLALAVPIRGVIEYPVAPFTQQMAWDGPDATAVNSGMIGNAKLGSDSLMESETCIGEKIESLRSLLKRYSTWATTSVAGTTWIVNPYMLDVANVPDAITVLQKPTCYPDPVNVWGSCFALSRGGMRVRTIGLNTTAGRGHVCTTLNWYISAGKILSGVVDVATNYTTNISYGSGNPMLIHDVEKSTGVELSYPQYHFAVSRSNASHICNAAADLGPVPSDYEVSSVSSTIASATNFTARYLLRSISDDYSMHCFISVPPMAAN